MKTLLVLAVIWSFFSWTERSTRTVTYQQGVTDCKDDIVQQWDGKQWHPVFIRKTKRTIPCPGV